MAVLPFASSNNGAGNTTRMPFGDLSNPAGTTERVASKLWLNVGYEVQTADGEIHFVTLPVGLPIDTMKTVQIRGQKEDWVQQAHAKNEFLELVQKFGAELKPGQEETVNFVVKIRRANEELDVSQKVNPYSIANAAAMFAKPALVNQPEA